MYVSSTEYYKHTARSPRAKDKLFSNSVVSCATQALARPRHACNPIGVHHLHRKENCIAEGVQYSLVSHQCAEKELQVSIGVIREDERETMTKMELRSAGTRAHVTLIYKRMVTGRKIVTSNRKVGIVQE
jgi:hypothetical protein